MKFLLFILFLLPFKTYSQNYIVVHEKNDPRYISYIDSCKAYSKYKKEVKNSREILSRANSLIGYMNRAAILGYECCKGKKKNQTRLYTFSENVTDHHIYINKVKAPQLRVKYVEKPIEEIVTVNVVVKNKPAPIKKKKVTIQYYTNTKDKYQSLDSIVRFEAELDWTIRNSK